MQYEQGTIDCHVLLDCKEPIEKMLRRWYRKHIWEQLQSVYKQIEGMHELKKQKKKENSF